MKLPPVKDREWCLLRNQGLWHDVRHGQDPGNLRYEHYQLLIEGRGTTFYSHIRLCGRRFRITIITTRRKIRDNRKLLLVWNAPLVGLLQFLLVFSRHVEYKGKGLNRRCVLVFLRAGEGNEKSAESSDWSFGRCFLVLCSGWARELSSRIGRRELLFLPFHHPYNCPTEVHACSMEPPFICSKENRDLSSIWKLLTAGISVCFCLSFLLPHHCELMHALWLYMSEYSNSRQVGLEAIWLSRRARVDRIANHFRPYSQWSGVITLLTNFIFLLTEIGMRVVSSVLDEWYAHSLWTSPAPKICRSTL